MAEGKETQTESSSKRKPQQATPMTTIQAAPGFDGMAAPLLESIGSDLGEATFDRHATLLGDHRLTHSANAGQRYKIVQALQRDYGNTYVQRLVKHVMRAEAAEARTSVLESPLVRAAEEENQTDDAYQVGPDAAARIDSKRGSGQPLDLETRRDMEAAFGHDLSHVRVHTGPEANELNRDAHAEAFATGKDIFFRDGNYNPESPEGTELLAHELTHVVHHNGVSQATQVPTTEESSTRVQQLTVNRVSSPTKERETELEEPATEMGEPAIEETVEAPLEGAPEAAASEAEPTAGAEAGPGAPPGDEATGQAPAAPGTAVEEGAEAATETQSTDEATQPAAEGEAPAPAAGEAVAPAGAAEAATGGEGAPVEGGATGGEATSEMPAQEATVEAEAVEGVGEAEVADIESQTDEVQSEAIAEAQTAVGSVEPLPPPPSLTELLEPVEEASSPGASTAPAASLAQPSEELGSRGVAGGPEIEEGVEDELALMINRAPAVGVAGPGAVAEPEYDPGAAQANVQAIVASLTAKSAEAEQTIQAQADTAKANLTANVDALRQSVQAKVASSVTTLRAQFQAQRTALQTSIEQTRSGIASSAEMRQTEAVARGEDATSRMQELFAEHGENVQNAVRDSITAAQELRDAQANRAHDRTQEQANEAVTRGEAKGSTYPDTKRGRKQAKAALGVANRTAQEILKREPETIKAIEDITVDIPTQFQEKGQEALQGLESKLPELIANIGSQVQSVTTSLNEQANQAYGQLTGISAQLNGQLDSLEQVATARAESIGPQAEAQLQAGLQTAISKIDEGVPQATGQISQVVDEAVQILLTTEEPDIEASNEMAAQITTFVDGTTSEVTSAIQQANDGLATEFQKVETATDEGLEAVVTPTTGHLQVMAQATASQLSEFAKSAEGAFEQAVISLEDSFKQVEAEVGSSLNGAVKELAAGFANTLTEAEGKVIEAVHKGLAKNDEALGELDAQMNEAAEDAGWAHDHPILAGLRSIGSFVLGALAAIAMILVVIVAAILIFKGLVFLLVVAGVATATAALIATVALAIVGVGMLLYGAYQAYQARRAAGQGVLGAIGGALLDVVGITAIVQSITTPGLSPYERGFMFTQGVATLAMTFIPAARAARRFLPKSIRNPFRRAPGIDKGLAGRGYRPKPGERSMTQKQWKAQHRAERMQRPQQPTQAPGAKGATPEALPAPPDKALAGRGYRPKPGERSMTREQWRAQHRAQRLEQWAKERGLPEGSMPARARMGKPGVKLPEYAQKNPDSYYYNPKTSRYNRIAGQRAVGAKRPPLPRGDDPSLRLAQNRFRTWDEPLHRGLDKPQAALFKQLEQGAITPQQAGNRWQKLVAGDLKGADVQEMFRRPGRRMDIGTGHEVTIEGWKGPFGSSKLDQFWLDLRDLGKIQVTVPRLSKQASSQLSRLGAQAETEFGREVLILVRQTLP